jgi:three-Cys-motif partner protein
MKKMQNFGSVWTEAKLNAIESYLDFYTTALKNQKFKLCYFDAFAGSGSIKIKNGKQVEGSSIRALKYPFDKFYFLEKDESIIHSLKQKVTEMPLKTDVEFHNADCNEFLLEIDKFEWLKEHWRGVIFLDPFAMDLEWACLEKISNTRVFDVWYLFPFMAVNRNLYTNGKIPSANKIILTRILGVDDWEKEIYVDSPQLNFFQEQDLQKMDTEHIKNYIISRLRQTFPTVSDKAVLLRNNRNSPQFLLCFAGSNPSLQAKALSLKAADYILMNIEKEDYGIKI